MSKRSHEISPGHATYMDTYAWVLFKLGRYPEARAWIEKAVGTGETDGTDWWNTTATSSSNSATRAALPEQWRKAKTLGGASDTLDRKINEGARVE